MEQEVFQQRLEEDRKLVEEALHQVCQGWRRYADLTEAMEYSLLAGGEADPPRSGAGDLPPVRRGTRPWRCPWPAVWR